MAEAVLAVHELTRRFGGVTAVDAVNLEVHQGETLGIIGPNGAGKSTLIGLVSGALRPSSGSVRIGGHDVTRSGAAARTAAGIGRTHQIPRPFGRMTVLENLLLAARHARGGHESSSAIRQRCNEVLERSGLADVSATAAGRLPLLRRKRLELARALALRPRVLLLDEIGAGLVEHETAELIELIQQTSAEVEATILVEHVMDVIVACCARTAVLNFGKLVTSGATKDVLADPEVAAVYLGTASRAHIPSSADSEHAPGPAAPQIRAVSAERIAARDEAAERSRTSDTSAPLLVVQGVEAAYGGVRALRGVDLEVRSGEVVALLGSNGAGKTTLARVISAVMRPTSGSLTFAGAPLLGRTPDEVTALGIAHCMEGRRIFATLSVEENLLLGAGNANREETGRRLAEVYDLFPVLAERRRSPGTAMSGGQQQMLAIGRALMAGPRLVIFDEISLGLAPIAVDQLYDALVAIRASGVAMVVVEQNLERGLGLADQAYVLAEGRIALHGPPDVVRNHPALASLYVGDVA